VPLTFSLLISSAVLTVNFLSTFAPSRSLRFSGTSTSWPFDRRAHVALPRPPWRPRHLARARRRCSPGEDRCATTRARRGGSCASGSLRHLARATSRAARFCSTCTLSAPINITPVAPSRCFASIVGATATASANGEHLRLTHTIDDGDSISIASSLNRGSRVTSASHWSSRRRAAASSRERKDSRRASRRSVSTVSNSELCLSLLNCLSTTSCPESRPSACSSSISAASRANSNLVHSRSMALARSTTRASHLAKALYDVRFASAGGTTRWPSATVNVVSSPIKKRCNSASALSLRNLPSRASTSIARHVVGTTARASARSSTPTARSMAVRATARCSDANCARGPLLFRLPAASNLAGLMTSNNSGQNVSSFFLPRAFCSASEDPCMYTLPVPLAAAPARAEPADLGDALWSLSSRSRSSATLSSPPILPSSNSPTSTSTAS
jgi:hypothetical protein